MELSQPYRLSWSRCSLYHRNLRKAELLLALREIEGAYSRGNLVKIMISVLEEYGIMNKLGYFVADGGSNDNTMVRCILNHLQLESGRRYGYQERRLFCYGHIINLVVQAFRCKAGVGPSPRTVAHTLWILAFFFNFHWPITAL